MNLSITNEAAKWYKEEFDLDDQSYLRFFVRYGFGGQIPGFSLGVSNDTPDDIYASKVKAGITFFVENKDAWYFDGKDLTIQLDDNKQEPAFIYN
ncbi:HesB/YadR/YfhF family protein [Lentibacillus sp. CBA3610]|uniref:HesB/YadR/YfhF family protein n=1 Tax=Lentibacillus sp. CBA3610 TaxID=2518176 RepID=UPI001595DC32|nr:HesB/YadR/YfhF family protein [Lentibacillus sp. CBA3610]QKY69121.1 hypothetical protein Len3610_05435 [Lentibacillus sp. CBA3610]